MTEYVGVVTGEAVLGANVFRDLFAGLRDIVGGRSAGYEKPDKALGLGGALRTLARQPFGPYLLGAVAVGLVAYGAFMFVMARYRKIKPA